MLALNSQENHAMKKNESLIENIDRLHTTPMGVDRIKRNLKASNQSLHSHGDIPTRFLS